MKIFGFIVVLVCVFLGYTLAGGHMDVILHALPFEGLTIMGAAIGAFLVANTTDALKHIGKSMKALVKPEAHKKDDYMELLSLLYVLFKLARTKGFLALEAHIENPHESDLFNQFPAFSSNHHALAFICDYFRIISLGNENPHEMESLMDQEIETFENHALHPGHALQIMADGVPALGIVAAVLGVIKTMGSITEPPEVLGKMIGGALVGTFLGVFLAYGFIGPTASALQTYGESQVTYYKCMKLAIIAFLGGAAPQVAVEFARKFLPHNVQPAFLELEDKLNEMPTPT